MGLMRDQSSRSATSWSSFYASEKYIDSIASLNPLTRKEEELLSGEIKKGGKRKKAAVSKLVSHNVKLVVTIAKSYAGMGLDMDDLISEGNLGLHEAAIRYDSDKGAKFSSYSSWWIKQKMRKALTMKSRNVRVPNSSLEKFNEIMSYINSYEEEHGEKPDRQQIAAKLNSTTKRIDSVVNAALGTLSLDAEVSQHGDDSGGHKATVYETIKDEGVETPSFNALKSEEKNIIENAFTSGELTPREVKVIKGRFGFGGGKRETLDKIGSKLQVTRERVRQIETIALFKIKNYLEGSGYSK